MPRPYADTLRSPAALARFFVVCGLGLAADLYTKHLAADRLGNGEVVTAIPGWLQFEFVKNPGAVFGIAPGQRGAFLVVSALAIAFLTYLFAGSGRRWFYQVVLGLLLAGVLGNMYDRVVYRSVRDMIHALPGWRWPAGVHHALHFLPADVFPYIFNVADTMLCVGVGVMLVYSFATTPPREPARPAVVAPVDA